MSIEGQLRLAECVGIDAPDPRRLGQWIGWGLLVIGLAGCRESTTSPPALDDAPAVSAQPGSIPPGKADEFLRQWIDNYSRRASSVDQVLVEFSYTRHEPTRASVPTPTNSPPPTNSEPLPGVPAQRDDTAGSGAPSDTARETDRIALSTSFERGKNWHLLVARGEDQIALVHDGTQLSAFVRSPGAADLHNQVVQRPATTSWDVNELYAATEVYDPARPTEMHSLLVNFPIPLQLTPLGLLHADPAWQQIAELSGDARWLPSVRENGRDYTRIELPTAHGPFVFWFDAAAQTIMRIAYPTENLRRETQSTAAAQNATLTATWQPSDTSTVARAQDRLPQMPTNALRLRYFVLPAIPLPSELFGEVVSHVELTPLGQNATEDLGTDLLHVLVWFQDHPTSAEVIPQIDRLAEHYRRQQQPVTFRAVCGDGSEQMSDARCQSLLQNWRVAMPVYRDTHTVGRDRLHIVQAPTTVVLDRTGRVHLFEVGANPRLAELVQLVVDRLLQGEDVAADVVRRAELERHHFERQLALAQLEVPAAAEPLENPNAQVATERDFTRIQATPRWTYTTLRAPGNLWCTTHPAPRGLVLDDQSQVVELNSDGQLVATHPLPDDAQLARTQWLGSHDAQGEAVYWTYARYGEAVEVLDGNFRRRLRYPDAADVAEATTKAQRISILDAQLLDLDADGQVELYLACNDPHGIHCVTLDGQRQWSQRQWPAVTSLAPSTIPGRLWCTPESGVLQELDARGQAGSNRTIGKRSIHALVTARQLLGSPERAQHVGLAWTLEGRLVVVGWNAEGRELWSYGLPAGLFATQVQGPQWYPIPPDGTRGIWLVAGPDGTLHGIEDRGGFHDYRAWGHDIRGFGLLPNSTNHDLWISDARGIHCLRVTFPN